MGAKWADLQSIFQPTISAARDSNGIISPADGPLRLISLREEPFGASRYDVCIGGGGSHGKADIVREAA